MANQPHTKRDQGGQKDKDSGGGKGNPAKNSPGKTSQGGGSEGKNDSQPRICAAGRRTGLRSERAEWALVRPGPRGSGRTMTVHPFTSIP